MAIANLLAYGGNSRIGAIGTSFAADVTRRVSQSKGLDAESVQPETEAAAQLEEKTAQLRKLESALGGTVAYMADKHGEKAASAMVAIVYKRLGDGEINEQTLGDAFLDVTRFIDANFGTSQGDNFMAHLNGSLNESLNEFFDNGLNETFMVAPTSAEAGGQAVAGLLQQLTEQYAEGVKAMLEEARKKAQEEQALTDARSPLAAYAAPVGQSVMQGVMKDMMV